MSPVLLLDIVLSLCANGIISEVDKFVVETVKTILEGRFNIIITNSDKAFNLAKNILTVFVDENTIDIGYRTPAQLKDRRQLKEKQMVQADKQQVANALTMGQTSNLFAKKLKLLSRTICLKRRYTINTTD